MTAEAGGGPTKTSLKAWWNHFTFVQRAKREPNPLENGDHHLVFGKPLRDSLKYASVQISTANASGELYVWGYIPVVVAKCGLYLKENATEVEGTFRVNGSNKRMRELQAIFETPPRYGKSMDWKQEQWTTHDVASVFRRYLTQMPEPVIPTDMYHDFRNALAKQPYNQEEVIATYKRLINNMPRANQYLLLYVLDLLSVFARKSDKNRMDAANLSVIFRPGLLSYPEHEMMPKEHRLSQEVLEFLIAHQDWFMLEVPPPPRNDSVLLGASTPATSSSPWHLPSSAGSEPDELGIGGGVHVMRRRTINSDRSPGDTGPREHASPLGALSESPRDSIVLGEGDAGVARSRTLPSSRTRSARRSVGGTATPPSRDEVNEHGRRVLRKPQRERDRTSQRIVSSQAP